MTNSHPRRRADDRVSIPLMVGFFAAVLAAAAFFLGTETGPAVVAAARSDHGVRPEPHALPLDVTKFHDASEEVTCWRREGGGISCLPDQWLASARAQDGAP